jgi:hypothetical protein
MRGTMAVLSRWFVRIILVGVVLDLAFSCVLAYDTVSQQRLTNKLQHVTQTAQCWDKVLDQSVGPHPASRATLLAEANKCAQLIP